MGFEAAPEYATYDDVPTLRKRWMFILLVLVLTPIGIILAFSGDIYALKDGEVVKFEKQSRILIAVAWTILLLTNLLRAYG